MTPLADAAGPYRSESVLHTSLRVALGVEAAFALAFVAIDAAGLLELSAGVWATALLCVVTAWGAFARNLSPAVRLATLLVPLAGSACVMLSIVGFAPSVVLALAAAVILARLFHSPALAWSLAGALALHIALAGHLIDAGILPGIQPGAYRPADPLSWLRVGAGFAGVTALLAYPVSTFVHRLDQVVHEQREALLRLARDERERLRAEDELKRVEAAVCESQRREALSRFAGGLAHDYSNQLVVILGWLDILAHATDEDTVDEGLRAIDKAVRASADLTRQLPVVPGRRIAKGPGARPDRVVAAEAATLRRVLPASIELCIDPLPTPHVELSGAQIGQVLLNLAMNARDAMPEGGRLSVTTERVAAIGLPFAEPGVPEYAVITVADTGIGMDADTRLRIFEPYFTTKGGRGTGLGLASVYGLVERFGGHIDVKSAPGAGARFTLHLPAAHVVETHATSQVAASGAGTILLADDDAQVRDIIRRALARAGFRVLEACDASEALALARSHAEVIQLLCTDGIMPGLETRTLVEAFQTLCPGRPILICSGHLDAKLLVRGIRAGDYAFLAKPFRATDLISRIQALIAQEGGST
jgi:signal transduction histidine kinase/ActR/RegA family two-component response regulator